MITQQPNGLIVIEFGNGDIGVSGGCKNLDQPELGCLVLRNIEQQEVGTLFRKEKKLIESDSYLVLTFSNPKSIDALIQQLEVTKEKMKEETK